MYRVNGPVRVAQSGENIFLLSLPKIGIKIEINQNVLDFIEFIMQKEAVDENVIKEYTQINDIVNSEDYGNLYMQMMEWKVLVQI